MPTSKIEIYACFDIKSMRRLSSRCRTVKIEEVSERDGNVVNASVVSNAALHRLRETPCAAREKLRLNIDGDTNSTAKRES